MSDFTDFTDQMAELCQMTVVWEPMTGRDPYGKPQYGPPVTFDPANNQGGYRVFEQVRVASGMGPNAVDGSAVDFEEGSTIYLLATPDIGLEDRLYIQGDPEPYPPILNRQRYADETGVEQFVVITMGSANG